MNKLSYNTILQLGQLLGKLTIKSLDHATLISIIQLKVAINKAAKEHGEIAEEIRKEFDVTPGMNGAIGFKVSEKEKAEGFIKAFDDLAKREVEIPNLKVLTSESFQLLHADNPTLIVDELVLITEHLIG